MKIKTIILIIAVLLLSYSLALQAQGVSYNQEFQVNTYTSYDKGDPSVSSLMDSGFVVCWTSDGQDGDWYGVYGQLFNSDGSRRGIEFRVNTYTSDAQWYPSVSSLMDGGFVVCWVSNGQDGSGSGNYGQLFNSDGSRRGIEFQVNTYTSGLQSKPSVSSLMDGGFVVCWHSRPQDGSDLGIYGQLFNSDGSRRGIEFQVNTYISNDQRNPSVSSLKDGGFVVCWESWYQDGSDAGIYGQLFNRDGSRRGTEFQVNSYTHSFQGYPTGSSLMDSGFVVCWDGSGQGGNSYGVYGQLFASDGSRRSSEFRVNTYTNSQQRYPSVSGLMDGGFVVCWQSRFQDGSGWGIYGQLFDSDGSRRGNEFRVNTYTSDQQRDPSASSLMDGGFVVCWASNRQDGSGYGIYGKYFLGEIINHQLIPFSLLEPTYDSIINTTRPLFKWRRANSVHINLQWELEYHLYLDEDEDFSNPGIFPAIYDTTCTVDSLTPGTTYFWKVLAKNIEGDSIWSTNINGFFISHDATAISETPVEKKTSFQLFANYPNPFNPSTTIEFDLPKTSEVTLKIFNTLGEEVATLVSDRLSAGSYSYEWDASQLASGVYLYRLEAGRYVETKKMILMR
jgi:hypothetical protein